MRRNTKTGLAVRWLVLGLVLGGVLSAVGLWSLTFPLRVAFDYRLRVALTGIAGLAFVLRDVGRLRFHVPQNRRQIPPEVLIDGGPRSGPLRFGIELGTGLRTYLPSMLPHFALVALILLGPDLAIAAIAGIGFGLGRGLWFIQQHWRGRDIAPREHAPAKHLIWAETIAAFAVLVVLSGL